MDSNLPWSLSTAVSKSFLFLSTFLLNSFYSNLAIFLNSLNLYVFTLFQGHAVLPSKKTLVSDTTFSFHIVILPHQMDKKTNKINTTYSVPHSSGNMSFTGYHGYHTENITSSIAQYHLKYVIYVANDTAHNQNHFDISQANTFLDRNIDFAILAILLYLFCLTMVRNLIVVWHICIANRDNKYLFFSPLFR